MARDESRSPMRIARDRLVARILSLQVPFIVIEAPAGCGKSWLLEDLAGICELPVRRDVSIAEPTDQCLWDCPNLGQVGALPADPHARTRWIMARRPGTAIPGLARAEVYGHVVRIGPEDLLFDAGDLATLGDGAALFARTGGWPCLIPAALAGAPAEALVDFLRDDVLGGLAGPQIVALECLLTGATGGSQPLPGPELLAGLPFVAPEAPLPLHPVLSALRRPLVHAAQIRLAEARSDPRAARAIAVAQTALGQLPDAIATFQSIGAWKAALSTLARARGPFYIHRFGPEALDRMLAGFPPDLRQTDDQLVLCRAIRAVKCGEVPLTRRILTERWGPVAADTRAMLADRVHHALDVRFFRLLFSTWEDFDLDRQYLDLAYDLLAELPPEDDLLRGSFYNAVLEAYIRARRFPEADHAARRAADHYTRAGVPILSFYIDLHRGIIALFLGKPAAAADHARAGARNLAAAAYDSPGDARLLSLLNACIAYEGGVAEPLSRFLSVELDEMAQGEVWPSLVELALVYGSQALAEQYSTIAARGYLDRWRATQDRASQFRMLIDIREVIVLQNANRWTEAAVRAASLPTRIGLAHVQGAGPGLATLQDRDEVAMALLWLRQMAQEDPAHPGLDARIGAMLDNPHLTARQRIGAEIWLAHVLHRTRRQEQALARLGGTLVRAAQGGILASLSDERGFVAQLTATRRQRATLERADPVRRVLRQLQDVGPGRARRGKAHGLTGQETRVLHALCEGSANKTIAKSLGLSEATVKFHLRNLYRKLGCRSRREAVAAATALRLVT